jgi:hypothetical protein
MKHIYEGLSSVRELDDEDNISEDSQRVMQGVETVRNNLLL